MDENQKIVYKIDSICRVCLSENPGMTNIFDSEKNIPEILMTCSDVKVIKNDGLPMHICKMCTFQATSASTFKNLCEVSDAKLRTYVTNVFQHPSILHIKEEDSLSTIDDLSGLFRDDSQSSSTIVNGSLKNIKKSNQNKNLLYDCALCDCTYDSSKSLIDHVLETHRSSVKNEQSYYCDICKRNFSSVFDLKRHQVTHKEFTVDGKTNICPICTQEFTRHGLLIKHIGYHLEESYYECEECHCYFTTNLHLKRHKTAKHMTEKDNSFDDCPSPDNDYSQDVPIKLESDEFVNDPIIKCEEFSGSLENDIDFDNEDLLSNLTNTNLKKGYVDNPLDKNDTSDDSSKKPQNGKNHKTLKLKSLKKKNKLKNIKVKLKKEGKKEKMKDKDLLTSDSKNQAIPRLMDTTDPQNQVGTFNSDQNSKNLYKRFPCDKCSKIFLKLDVLVDHKKRHTGELSYLCSICGKGYFKQVGLEKHMQTHKNEPIKKKIHSCHICGKVVSHSNHLLVHMRTHRDKNGQPIAPQEVNTNKKLILCSMCGKSCSSRSNLAVHMRRHLGVMTCMCKICGKGYPRTTDLTLHMRQHTGERPFVCAICNKGFARSDKLSIHMRIHTGEKPYTCTECGRGFAQSNDLAAHRKRNNCTQSQSNSSNSRNMNLAAAITSNNLLTNENQLMLFSQNRGFEFFPVDSTLYAKHPLKNPSMPSFKSYSNKHKKIEPSLSEDSEQMFAHTRALELVASSNNTNNRVLDIFNSDSITVKTVGDLVKQNLVVPKLINVQRGLDIANSSNIPAQHQRPEYIEYTTATLLQNLSNASSAQFDI